MTTTKTSTATQNDRNAPEIEGRFFDALEKAQSVMRLLSQASAEGGSDSRPR